MCIEQEIAHPAERKSNDSDSDMKIWAERWLSAPRLGPYHEACDGDIEVALKLYEWNIGLGKVLIADIAHFEVALRNAYNRVMCERWNHAHWLLDAESPVVRPIVRMSKQKKPRDVNLMNRKAIAQARDSVRDRDDPDQIISGLTLGFWTHLTDRSRERDLWIPYLNAAWPRGTDRAKLNHALVSINQVRNRVAHNERLFNPRESGLSPAKVDSDILRMLWNLCPEAAEYLYGCGAETPVNRYVCECPPPTEISL